MKAEDIERETQALMEHDRKMAALYMDKTVFVVPEQMRGIVKRVDVHRGRVWVEFAPDPLHFPDEKYDGWYDFSEVILK